MFRLVIWWTLKARRKFWPKHMFHYCGTLLPSSSSRCATDAQFVLCSIVEVLLGHVKSMEHKIHIFARWIIFVVFSKSVGRLRTFKQAGGAGGSSSKMATETDRSKPILKRLDSFCIIVRYLISWRCLWNLLSFRADTDGRVYVSKYFHRNSAGIQTSLK